jgi:hypothetical protein
LLSEHSGRVVHLRPMTISDDPEPKRRQLSVSAREARDAAHIVRAINDRIGHWHAESIRLATAADRMRQSSRHEPGVVEAIRVMTAMVEQQQNEFGELLVELPEGVAQHSRIQDTQQALAMITARLKGALPA